MEIFTGESPHQPLSQFDPSEIRLVKLYPGDFNDAVRCELEHVSLAQDTPAYTAVSYTWGDPHVTDSILLDGVQYPVTVNLQSFLRHMQAILLAITKFLPGELQVPRPYSSPLRHFVVRSILEDSDFPQDFPLAADSVMHRLVKRHVHRVLTQGVEQNDSIDEVLDKLHENVDPCDPTECSLYFWIDALCINQRDVHERSLQVGRIKEVYSNAPSLLIWLGDALESTAKGAMSLIHDIQTVAWPYLEGSTEDMNQFSSEDFVHPRLDEIRKFMQFLTQGWFSRMWIIQEVATATGSTVALVRFQPVQWRFLAHVVFACCSQMLSLSDDLQPLLTMARNRDEILKTLLELTRCYKGWIQETRTQPDGRLNEDVAQRLKKLLQCSKGLFQATNPRDLLYALLGLLGTGSIPHELRPNYDIPFEKVFHQYAMYIIKHTKGLGFLPCYKRQLEGVPSWVPDWRYCVKGRSDLTWLNSDLSYIEVSEDGMRLEVDGIRLGQVVDVVHPVSIATNIEKESLFSRDTADGADNDDVTVLAGILAVFRGMQKLKRVCLESLWAVSPNVSHIAFQNQWEKFWPGYTDQTLRMQVEMLEGRRKLELREVARGAAGVYFVVLGDEIRSLSQKGIAILDGANLVSSIRQGEPIKNGDTICVLKGMNCPCILRREGLYYRFISDCDMTSLTPSDPKGEFNRLHQPERFILV